MADSSIRISLELADAAAQKALSDFIAKAGSADSSFKKLGDSSQSTFGEIGLHIGKATGLFEIFAGNLAVNVVIGALDLLAESAHKAFDVFIVEGVKAAEETQNAINALNQSLANSGQYSKETSEDFVRFAEGLQKTTTFSHDAIITNAALIQSLAQLDENGLKRATKAALDLSVGLGKDLPAATLIVAKAAEGNVTALNKLGLSIQEGETHAQTFERALAALEGRFGGDAESKVATYSGAVAQAGNSFKDLTEQIGNVIVQNPVVISLIQGVGASFNELGEFVKANAATIKDWVATGVIILIDGLKLATQAIDICTRAAQVLIGVMEITSGSFAAGIKNIKAFGESGNGTISAFSKQLEKMEESATTAFAALKTGATGSTEPINSTTVKTRELTAEMLRQQAMAKSLADSLIKNAEEGKSSAQQETAIAKAESEKQLAINESQLRKEEIDEVQFTSRKLAIGKMLATSELVAQEKELDAKQKFLDDSFAKNLLPEKQYYAASAALRTQEQTLETKYSNESIARDERAKKTLLDAERKQQNERLSIVATAAGNLASLMQSSNAGLFEIGRVAAMAQAGINTIVGISNALAGPPTGPPWPFNIALAATQGVALAVQESNLASAKPPSFASGGIVPGNSFSGDRVAANVNSGEMILNQYQQKNLFDMANGGGGTSRLEAKMDKQNALLGGIFQSLQGGQSININGQAIFQVLRDGMRGGQRFA